MRLFYFHFSRQPDGINGGNTMDEVQQVTSPESIDQATEQTATPDAPGKQAESRTFTQAEVDAMMKERLARAERQATEKADKARQEAEAKALIDQGKFKELYEAAQAQATQATQRAKDLELSALRRDVATRVGLPTALAARLQGDDEATIEADAKQLMAALPKPTAPNINAAPGGNPAQANGAMTPEDKLEFAARYGVNPKYVA